MGYHTLAGRLRGSSGHCNNAGLPFVIIERSEEALPYVDEQMMDGDEMSRKEKLRVGDFCHRLEPKAMLRGKVAPMTVQVTMFMDGVVLGVCMGHVVADGHSFAQFMEDWSRMHKGGVVPPVIPLPIWFNTPPQLCDIEEAAHELGWGKHGCLDSAFLWAFLVHRLRSTRGKANTNPPPRICLSFTAEQLRVLKERAEEGAESWVSTQEALLAHIYSQLLEACDGSMGSRVWGGVVCVVNLRGRVVGIE